MTGCGPQCPVVPPSSLNFLEILHVLRVSRPLGIFTSSLESFFFLSSRRSFSFHHSIPTSFSYPVLLPFHTPFFRPYKMDLRRRTRRERSPGTNPFPAFLPTLLLDGGGVYFVIYNCYRQNYTRRQSHLAEALCPITTVRVRSQRS